ncbi:MAG TPA: hypothetical protein PLA12_14225 [Candidatus Hydrogenedens sp.]|nr:hypothetical protein [Candidatus Hydrogenedens sp.]
MTFFVDALMKFKLGNPSVLDYMIVKSAKTNLLKANDPFTALIGMIL